MKRRKITKAGFAGLLLLLAAALLMGACAKPAPAPAPAPAPPPAPPKEIKWNFAQWGGPRHWTSYLDKWAEDMNTQTNGQWQIKIHYGAVLAKQADFPDAVRDGLCEGATLYSIFTPGKLPLCTVLGLPFLTPTKVTDIVRLGEWVTKHPAIIEELGKWNAMVLWPTFIEPYELMGNKRIAKVEDLKGARIRIAKDAGLPLEEFGAVSVMVPTADIYTGLERGTFDLVAPSLGAAYDYKWYEVSKYAAIDLGINTVLTFQMGNKDAWDALPDEFKKLHTAWWEEHYDDFVQERLDRLDEALALYKERLEVINFPPDERAKLEAVSKRFWDEWVDKMEADGLPGRKLLDDVLAKRKEISGF